MKLTTRLILLILMIPSVACHRIEEWDNNAQGNFEALWTVIDEHYCFFAEKDIDWQVIHDKYSRRVYNGMSSRMLFDVCADMVNELRDGHVNLASGFNTSYYNKWWSDYPENFNQRIIQESYLHYNYKSLGGVYYGTIQSNIGYVRYGSFSSSLGEGNIDNILSDLSMCNGLIIDVRSNGGGNLTNAESLIRRFLTDRTLVGYVINKTGPGHNDFSEPAPYYYSPTGDDHILWRKPVVVLTNRGTFSAANNFVSIMKYLPNVTIVGARTGGGSGMPITMEIPIGWSIRMSSVSILDAQGNTTETGIDPSEGCEVDMDPTMAMQNIDTMLEKAIAVLNLTDNPVPDR